MFMSEQLQEKWAPILEHKDAEPIQDSYKKGCHLSTARKPREVPT